jgi:formamidopyrimidine-DNA glycosylase
MPELPEVETTRRGLLPVMKGQEIVRFEAKLTKLRQLLPLDLSKRVVGRTVVDIYRRGKYLIFDLGELEFLLLHLGMSGSLLIGKAPSDCEKRRKHEHLHFHLSKEVTVTYHDPRRFGLIDLYQGSLFNHPLLSSIGPEPLEAEFNGTYLKSRLHKIKRPIKGVLLDKGVVAGVGNIYANEALFYAGISPIRLSGDLSYEEIKRLVDSIKKILSWAIKRGGTTLRDYTAPDLIQGEFSKELAVYSRKGLSCKVCNSIINETRISGRSTFFCPQCQREDG